MKYSQAILISGPDSLVSQGWSLDASAVELGFRRMVDFLQTCEHDLLDVHGPVAELASHSVRSLTRSTRHYYMALNASLQPQALKCAKTRRACVEASLGGDASEEEIESILALDLPRKMRCGCSRVPCCDDNHSLMRETHFNEFQFRLAGVGEELDRLCSEIRLAIAEGILFRRALG